MKKYEDFLEEFFKKFKLDKAKNRHEIAIRNFLNYLEEEELEFNLSNLKFYLAALPEEEKRMLLKFYLNSEDDFIRTLALKGTSANTLTAYETDLISLFEFLFQENFVLDLKAINLYKEYLYKKFKPTSAARKLIIANKYFKHLTGEKSEVVPMKIQRHYKEFMTQQDYDRIMRQVIPHKKDLKAFLSKDDYERVVEGLREKKEDDRESDFQTAMIMEVLVKMGLRYSELQFLTVAALKARVIEIRNKGTVRKVFIGARLIPMLEAYAKKNKIKEGIILRNSKGNLLDHVTFFRKIKKYAGLARVKKDRIFPHSFRHLFAKNYLTLEGQAPFFSRNRIIEN